MRFRLAPTTPEDALPPATAPAAAAAPARASAAPAPAPARAAAPAVPLVERLPPRLREHRVLLAVGLGILVLLAAVGGGVYAFSADARYPEGYLLESDELPSGVREAQLPGFVLAQLGVERTPGPMGEEHLQRFSSDSGVAPEEGWLQVFGASSASPDVFLFAFRFESRDAADEWLVTAHGTCRENDEGSLLRDRSVVVMLVADSKEDLPMLSRVAAALEEKSPKLDPLC